MLPWSLSTLSVLLLVLISAGAWITASQLVTADWGSSCWVLDDTSIQDSKCPHALSEDVYLYDRQVANKANLAEGGGNLISARQGRGRCPDRAGCPSGVSQRLHHPCCRSWGSTATLCIAVLTRYRWGEGELRPAMRRSRVAVAVLSRATPRDLVLHHERGGEIAEILQRGSSRPPMRSGVGCVS